MPLPSDEKIIALANDLLQQFEIIFGQHPGFRPAHAKGVLLAGTFTPSAAAPSLTRAPHMNRPSTRVMLRFSNSTGLPLIPDNNPNAHPHACAVRFYLADRVHTDIISVGANGFPVRTGQEFLEFLKALAASDPAKIAGSPLEAFLGSHPKALAFVQMPKPAPASFAAEPYFGVNAMRFINKDGASQYGRFRLVPEAPVHYLSDSEAAGQSDNYLFDEVKNRLAKAPIGFRVMAQLASPGDPVDDATEQWPEDRKLLDLGAISLTAPVADDAKEQQMTIFDPIPRVDGIDPSDDPLLEVRSAVYLISGRRRRAAPASAASA